MAILVTGGTGYIGSHTAIELLKSGEDITKSILIDDSIENISNWVMNGGIGILYDVNNRFKSNDDYYVIHSFDYDEIMNVMYQIAEKENKKRGKVYQL